MAVKVEELVRKQKMYFRKGHTVTYAFRLKMLEKLKCSIRRNEDAICYALQKDLHKSRTESYMTEVGMVLSELSYFMKHLKGWMMPRTVRTPLAQFPSRSFTVSEPYGVTLIMAPWNYPFLLSMAPLLGAIAGGNCAIIKPSAYGQATSAVIKKIIRQTFPESYIAVVEGGRQENNQLLEQPFDYIFFTGSVGVGKQVMAKAAAHLTPVTLELGGKSPCIIDRTADLDMAAKRIVFGKFINAGQTCVAPDFVLIQEECRDEFIQLLGKWITRMLGENPLKNRDYPRMINRKHFRRVCSLIEPEKVALGGAVSENTLQIAPTVLRNVTWKDRVMKEEIFGPVLPVLTFHKTGEALAVLSRREKPLALYLFTRDKALERKILTRLSFGGGCINDTIIHLATPYMGFGGVGNSGMGNYHGKNSFETFTHRKSMVKKALWPDLPFRYQPYTGCKSILIRLFLR